MANKRKRCDPGECGRMDWEARIAKLELALKCIRATAAFEQAHPTGLGMTCLSIIEKEARKALEQ